MFNQINCSNPRLIINPKLPMLINKYRHYFFLGREHHIYYNCPHPRSFDLSPFFPKKHGISVDTMNDCFVVDDSTGETFPIYLLVPCGKCDICKVTKINSFVSRCRMESQMYSSQPWFGTLTYSPDNLPSDGVSVREMQLWLKRFRIDLVRAGFSNPIRYCIVGEYGKKTHRPHYHFIIWGIVCKSHHDFILVDELLKKSWNKGFIRHRIVDMKQDKAFYYTTKYLKKDCFVPDGCNPCFMLSSRKHGGIGAPFIDKHKDKIRKSLNTEYKFRDKWTGQIRPFVFSRYVLDRVFPSFCRSVSSEFRSALYDASMVIQNFDSFVSEHWRHYFSDVFDKVSRYIFIPFGYCNKRDPWLFDKILFKHSDFEVDSSALSRFCLVELVLQDCKSKIDKMIDKFDFAFCKLIDAMRFAFLGKMFEFFKDIDIKQREFECMNILSWESPLTCYV